MAEPDPPDAVFRIYINADIQRVWRELTKTGEAQGAVFNAWLHTTGLVPGGRLQMRTGSGKHVLVDGAVVAFEPPHRFVHSHRFTQYDDPVCQVAYELKAVAELGLNVRNQTASTHAARAHRTRPPRGDRESGGRIRGAPRRRARRRSDFTHPVVHAVLRPRHVAQAAAERAHFF